MRGIINLVLIGLTITFFLQGCAVQQVPLSVPEEVVRIEKAEEKTSNTESAEELKTSEVVSPEERMKTYPSPGEYVAFSLKVAQKMIAEVKVGQNYRVVYPEVYNLGGINQIHGLVYDRQVKDMILVGKYDPDRQPLTLDDFVVALRARFIHGKWPLVSIDPTPETEKTEMQIVRFEGGIEDTQFGADLFDADYRLKRIGMGILPPGISGLKTYWDLDMERAKEGTGGSHKISSRFWFYPVLPSVSVREDVVAIKGLKVGVFTEVLSAEIDGKEIEDLSTFQHIAGAGFAKAVSDNFEELCKVHQSFSRVQGLDELVALTKAIEEMDRRPNLSFWLKDYQIKRVETEKGVKVLRREEEYELPRGDGIYRRYQEFSGGVQLMAIALKVKAGDVTALKEAVLKTRHKPDALSWSFVVGEWLIPTSPEMLKVEDIAPLFAQAVFLQEKRYYDDAITLYGKIIELKPDWDWPYNNRGVAYGDKGQYDQAISDFNKALEINSRYAEAYSNRGNAYYHKGEYDQAILEFNKALEINPSLAKAYYNRGAAYCEKGLYGQAILDCNKALEINPSLAEAYNDRALAYHHKGEYDQAILDYNKALEINSRYAEAYNNRGAAYSNKGKYDQAISDFNKALEINPTYVEAYLNKGIACQNSGRIKEALEAYKHFIQHAPVQYAPYIEQARQRIKELGE